MIPVLSGLVFNRRGQWRQALASYKYMCPITKEQVLDNMIDLWYWRKGLPSGTHVLEKLNRLGFIERRHETPCPLLVPAGQILAHRRVIQQQKNSKYKAISYILSMTINMKQA